MTAARNSRQAVVVTTDGWGATDATVQRFQRETAGDPWRPMGSSWPATLGSRGLGWGAGLAGVRRPEGVPAKREGDWRSPAGVFELYAVFGLASPDRMGWLRMPYRPVRDDTEAVDDPKSRYYNRIVDRQTVARPDWVHKESMHRVGGRYRVGLMVEHNWDQRPGAGSCIFLHVWAGPGQTTAGCTAMSERDLRTLLHWLDASRKPVLVQLPSATRRPKTR